MNKSLITGVIAGVVVTAGAGAVAGYKMFDRQPRFAEVLDVQPVEKTIRTPRQECHDEVVTQKAPTKDPKQITGSVIGAVVGGVAGHQIGDGDGRRIATAAGAAAGGYAGNRIQKRMQDGRVVTTTEQRCETVYDTHVERRGYDVRYRIGEEEGRVRMDHHPGERIPLRAGQLVLDGRSSS
jgi:uncharacterized protein YcfJ